MTGSISAHDIERSAIDTAVTRTYAEHGGALTNAELYEAVAEDLGLQMELFTGASEGRDYNANARAARWSQQTLKTQGLIERVDRGRWRITAEGKHKLRRPVRGMHLVAFSTDLGVAVWGDCRDVIARIDERVTLCVTSPPYPIAKGRAYGRIAAEQYVDWLCGVLEGVVARLAPGGSIVLVLGNEVFENGCAARVPYIERLTLALIDRLGLWKMDALIWHNPSKAPGPVQYASKQRVQLNAGYETLLWLTNDPDQVRADNRRVLQPHSARHTALMAAGGEVRETCSQDGAYRLRPGRSFANVTPGRIPRNVLIAAPISSAISVRPPRLACPATARRFPSLSRLSSWNSSASRVIWRSTSWPGRRHCLWQRNASAGAGWPASVTANTSAAVQNGFATLPGSP